MFGLGKKIYYNLDGTMDWLRTIVRSVYSFRKNDVVFVVSMAAKRAQKLYYKKTDIKTLYRGKCHE